MEVSPDGRVLACADMDESIRFWNMTSGGLIDRLKEGVGWVKTIAFSPDGRASRTGAKRTVIFSSPTPRASGTKPSTLE